MKKPKIKICCISSVEEARMAIDFGAAALGLVGNMPSGPGIITDDLILTIAQTVPPPIATFLLTSETNTHKIIAHHQKVHTNTIQIVDSLKIGQYTDIRAALPMVKLVQVIHVIDESSIEEAQQAAQYVDCLLLDSGNPNLAVKELGGTGRTHNWALSRKIRESVKIPLFLAGGINADNIRNAIDAVTPFGIDLCSSVRTDKKLDPHRLEKLFNAIEK
jgi:phosphoribosylanthranilate isomerase